MAKKKVKSAAPSGCAITRNNGNFACSWKMPKDKYGDGVKFRWGTSVNKAAFKYGNAISIGKNVTSRTISLGYANYYPYTNTILNYVAFQAQGNTDPKKDKTTFSDWAGKAFDVKIPIKPSISVSRNTAYSSTVTIKPNYTANGAEWATRIQYKTRLDLWKNGKQTVGKWSGIANYAIAASKDVACNEDNATIQKITENDAAVRYFAAQVQGPQGDSGWTTYALSYSAPNPATKLSGTVTENLSRSSCTCVLGFTYTHYTARPVNSIKIQYAFAAPNSDLTANSPEWQDATLGGDNTIKPPKIGTRSDATYTTKVQFIVNQLLPENQLLYARVITSHNNRDTQSAPVLLRDAKGEVPHKLTVLSKPTITNVEPPQSDNKIVVHVTNNCTAASAFLVVRFLPNSEATSFKEEDIGIITTNPPDQSQDYDFTVEIPPNYTSSFKIGVYAVVGSYSLSAKIPENYDTQVPPVLGYKTYAVSPKIRSDMEDFGGYIPLPPSNVQTNHLGNGNVMVTWDWKWAEADSAEVAWSDYSDALDSTEPPSTYLVTNNKANKLIVKNLELGKTWCFWVRLIKGDNTSAWSNVKYESLSSSPNVPSLVLSKEYITMDETVTVSWAYTSTDGSPQAAAKIHLCTVENGIIIDGGRIADIPNDEQTNPEAQYIVLDPKDPKLNWSSGNSYSIVIKVTSASGLESTDWSTPVTINVVEPVEGNILSTSLSSNPTLYDPTDTYSKDDYVYRIIDDPNDSKRDLRIMYKALANISTPEEFTDDHWVMVYEELTALPLTVTTDDVNDGVNQILTIERAEDYFLDRPDEKKTGGFAGEIVYRIINGSGINRTYSAVLNPVVDDISTYYEYDSQTETYVLTQDTSIVSGKTYYTVTITRSYEITQDSLSSYLDDGALYYLTYRLEDAYNQSYEIRREFRVKWNHQAIEPSADVEMAKYVVGENEYNVAKITINNPDSQYIVAGDSCDIYRISANSVDLLYQNAEFGQTYVDPYPTIGEHGGHRVVFKTVYGDYITNDNAFAWLDFDYEDGDLLSSDGNIIDFGQDNVKLMFNMDVSNSWSKDFQETRYLGGSIQGDWNAGVSMSSSISANVMTNDWATVSKVRDLAEYEGVCHIRTRDGMNYLANINVSEKIPYEAYFDPTGDVTHIGEYSFNITRVDPIELDGMTLKDWEENIADYEIPVDPGV